MVNGEERTTESQTLEGLCRELSLDGLTIATARNEEFIARPLRAQVFLADGDRIEILSPRQGG